MGNINIMSKCKQRNHKKVTHLRSQRSCIKITKDIYDKFIITKSKLLIFTLN